MSRRYKQGRDGVPDVLEGRRHRFTLKRMCCDCRLVHVELFKVNSANRMTWVAWRDDRATKAARRSRRGKRS